MTNNESVPSDAGAHEQARTAWMKPELARLSAGSAENSTGPSDDDGVNYS